VIVQHKSLSSVIEQMKYLACVLEQFVICEIIVKNPLEVEGDWTTLDLWEEPV